MTTLDHLTRALPTPQLLGMVSDERWKRAQAYERGYWATRADSIALGPASGLGFYKWRAGQLVKLLNANGLQNLTAGASSVVEIGSGPVGLISFYPGKPRIAVDPASYHRWDDLRAGPRGVVKGLLGVSEFVTTVIGTRGSRGAT